MLFAAPVSNNATCVVGVQQQTCLPTLRDMLSILFLIMAMGAKSSKHQGLEWPEAFDSIKHHAASSVLNEDKAGFFFFWLE